MCTFGHVCIVQRWVLHIIAVNIFFQYGGGDGVDMKEFPEFNFTDQKIDPINISQ
jgi:hypothetical protein